MYSNAGYCPQKFLTNTLHLALLLVAMSSALAHAESKQESIAAGEALTVEAAVGIALAQSPQLRALDAHSLALGTIPSQVGSLPDPVLSLNALNLPTDTFELDQEPMTQIQFAVSQKFPFPGKRRLRSDVAEFEAQAAQSRTLEHRDAITGAVRSAWWRLFYFDRALEIVAQNQDLMRDFVEIARTKYSVGKGLQQDVLLAQLELSRLLDREVRLRGRKRNSQAELNALLDRPTDNTVSLAANSHNTNLPELPAEAELLSRAVESRHLLDVHRDLLGAADRQVALARKDVYPDFRLGAGYGIRQGDDPLRGERPDFFSVMFSVNVPLYHGSKQSKAIEQRNSERERRKYGLDDVYRGVEASITRRLADYEAAREQVLLFDTAIIPQAQQTVASMLAGYQVNQVDFLNVMNGQLMLYNAQIDYWESMSDAKRALASLAAAVGVEALYE